MLSPEAVAKAADATAAQGGVRMAMDATVTAPGQPSFSMAGSGVMDQKTQRGRIVVSLADVPGAPDDAKQEVVFDDFTMYMRSPVFGDLPGDKEWVEIDLRKAGKEAGIDFDAMSSQGQDPTQILRYLKGVSGDVERVGDEDVRGVGTTHYKATIEYARIADTVPASDRAAVRRSVEQIVKLSGEKTAPVEVWIDDDDLVRRMKMEIPIPAPTGANSTMKMQFDLFDFGTAVNVTTPSDDETLDLTDLAAEGARELTK